ncbi:hypothetical protein TWF569_006969 [Orbilia oligospora]|uniref:INO80 complex subunit B-like conserved region domain-containing protein n=2 Tax=Orbilia oligospora TaxID=2813651 RepID=A0A7C8N5T3_ORBOL|nr:hypothetical protein TWF102_011933 [Orbilia oligospora]KAF3117575.1 hypothetical protein TWF103_006301 [Orbilia oligospora]KAF3144769.1 hypothetical protein TWF569_006969 [Orbilia oligospora]
MTGLLVFPVASTSSFIDVGIHRDRVGRSDNPEYFLPLDKDQAYDWILRRSLERVSDTRAYKPQVWPTAPLSESVARSRVPSKRHFEDFSIDYPPAMADRRSSRRIAAASSQPSAAPTLQAQNSRGTRSSARKEDKDDSAVSQPSTRSHTRTASAENLKPSLAKTSSNIRSVPAGRSTRTSAATNTRSQPSRTSGRSQPTRNAATTSTNTRSRRRLPSSDSEDDDSNIDIADDDDVEASQESEEEGEEEEEEEESEPAPKRPSRGAGTRQMPARRAAKAVFSDEDAPGETDDGMDIDEEPSLVVPGTVRGKLAVASEDEDAEGEPDEDTIVVRAPTAKAIPRSVPIPKIVEPESDEEDDDEDDDEEDEEDEDAEGEAADDDDDEEMDDSMMATPDISRPDTPNLKGLTRRQLGKFDSVYAADLMELPDDFGTTKKAAPLTAAEQASRRAEMARRRKNQSEQRREEEKMETINKLLKRQATKVNRRSQKQLEDENAADEVAEAGTPEPAEPPKMIRWVSNKNGSFVGVPQNWLDAPVGTVFKKQDVAWRRGIKVGLVEELPDETMTGV